ncbi:CSN8/PSMD8/EIF3K family protein [Aspergillus saccharolyticus JOP 1030-1]|uniref:CSN8/PSMD8/EIF3K domain-containing protein n=1 Tax=Aspergillus saccharolyticus JOP 1030-1 TaxID=1450539 RepID=A0A319A3C8_9EURO|nr:hypothetical protein BP01DRAFT_373056 [Aspergillus saccharolyticus JOP 1030-1]PYH46648.1 hypothetical protein BP01DRAFT_373056 [Aspergillus saccharolyticus JOP 1030-1]
MEASDFSQAQLAAAISSAATPSKLYDTLSPYEEEAYLLSFQEDRPVELLSHFYAAYFFSHLLTDQIYEARFLTKRMPQDLLHTDNSLQNCVTLLRAIWQHKHESVYKILRESPWPDLLKPIVQSYDTYFQDKTLREVSRVYEAIRPAAAASYLGLDPESTARGDTAAIEKLIALGWTRDEQSGLLYPKPIADDSQKDARSYTDLSQIMALIGSHRG